MKRLYANACLDCGAYTRRTRCQACSVLARHAKADVDFWQSADRSGGPHACWPWLLSKRGQNGKYGQVSYRGRPMRAHRTAWLLTNGPIPDGLLVLHRCDNPPCINPAHLFLGTHTDNMADRKAKGRNDLLGARGESNTQSRLTQDQVYAIRARWDRGESSEQIAVDFPVTRYHVRNIGTRFRWHWLPERPATRSGQNDLAGVWGAASRDDSARSGSPVVHSPPAERG
jgi:hypothetical protein